MNYRSAAITDIGRVRQQNEDRFLRSDEKHLFGVAAGIAGLPAGAAAARRTVEWLSSHFDPAAIHTARDLIALTLEVNRRVCSLGEELSPLLGMGTTLTFGTLHGND